MAKVFTFLAEGFEIVEAYAVVDVLKRAGIETVTVSVTDSREVTSSHKVTVKADTCFSDVDYADGDCVFLPGGMPGTLNLEACAGLLEVVKNYYSGGKLVTAICAAPSVLGHLGILDGRDATCYPGFEKELFGANYTGDKVVCSDNVVTAKGMGAAIDLGLKIVEILIDKDKADGIASQIQYR